MKMSASALTEHPAIDASDIEVSSTITSVKCFTARLSTRPVSVTSASLTETVSGVKEVHNQLRVARLEENERPRPSSEERRETHPQETIAPKTRRR